MSNADLVRSLMQTYLAQDREAAEQIIADDFVFTSPQDDHIGREEFFERCFPTAHRFRNVELSTVRDGRIIGTQVFFGGRTP